MITIDRLDLTSIMMGQMSLAASIAEGTAQTEGNVEVLAQLAAALVTFEMGFEVFPGTAGQAPSVDLNPFEVSAESKPGPGRMISRSA